MRNSNRIGEVGGQYMAYMIWGGFIIVVTGLLILLYASLSEEETQSPALKEKQRIIQKTAEELLQIAKR